MWKQPRLEKLIIVILLNCLPNGKLLILADDTLNTAHKLKSAS